jgi:hypothetical protein
MATPTLKQYKMTILEMQALMRASHSAADKATCVAKAIEVWKAIALRCGCKHETVQGVPGKGPRFFLGEPIDYNNQKIIITDNN